MKKLIAIILIFTIAFACLGCSVPRSYEKIQPSWMDNRFLVIDDSNNGLGYMRIIVDKDTGVMYLFHGSGYRGGMTTMVDSNGEPLIYDGGY
jgi:hypothetical protein